MKLFSPIRGFLLLLSIAVLAAASNSLHADDSAAAWQAHMDAAGKARADKDWESTNRAYRSAAEAAEDLGPGDPRLIKTLEQWSIQLTAQRRSIDAARAQQRAVSLRGESGDPTTMETVRSVHRLANLLNQIGPFDEAEAAYRKALELRRSVDGDTYPTEVALLRSLQSVIARLRRDDPERQEILSRILELDDSSFHRLTFANSLADRAEHERALEEFRIGLEMEETSSAPSRTRMVSFLTGMGHQHRELGRVDEAETLYERALQVREQTHGPDHPYQASLLRHLGELYVDEGRFREAEPILERALERDRAAWGDRPSRCSCDVRDLLRQVYEALGREAALIALGPPDSEHALDESHLEQEERSKRQELLALDEEAGELARTGHFEDSIDRAERSLRLREELFGTESLAYVTGMHRMAHWLDRRTRYDEAIERFRLALDGLRKIEGVDDQRLADTLRALGNSLRTAGRQDEAVPYFEEELALRESLGHRLRAAWILETLASIARTEKDFVAARDRLARAIDLWREMADDTAPEITRIETTLARTFIEENRLAEAEQLLVRIRKEVEASDPEPSRLLQVLHPLADVYRKAARTEELAAVEARTRELRNLRR